MRGSAVGTALAGAAWMGAIGAAALAGPAEPRISFRRDESAVVLRFTERAGELGEKDAPSVTVHGDGKVVVHRPPFFVAPGDHEYRLTPDQLDSLVSAVADAVASFDADAVARARRESIRRQRQRGVLYRVSDPDVAIFEVHLESWSLRPGEPGLPVDRTVSWSGLRHDAERHPEIEALVRLDEASRRLLELLARPQAEVRR